mmetsp:Transcript_30591/g.73853  ORF Transcript_30591/g.73853 Transcript_30591/m.73853 type:complete len:203 (+) Transcript_30591:1128-1736(+)
MSINAPQEQKILRPRGAVPQIPTNHALQIDVLHFIVFLHRPSEGLSVVAGRFLRLFRGTFPPLVIVIIVGKILHDFLYLRQSLPQYILLAAFVIFVASISRPGRFVRDGGDNFGPLSFVVEDGTVGVILEMVVHEVCVRYALHGKGRDLEAFKVPAVCEPVDVLTLILIDVFRRNPKFALGDGLLAFPAFGTAARVMLDMIG